MPPALLLTLWKKNIAVKAGAIILTVYYFIAFKLNINKCSSDDYSCRCNQTSLVDFESLKTLATDDQRVLDYIYCSRMKPPSRFPYPDSIMRGDPSEFKGLVSKIFKNKTGGFFIECGAHDGYFFSNTLVLERDHQWSGLLIEANPEMNQKLITRNRKAWVSDACLSPYNNVSEIEFLVSAVRNRDPERGLGKLAMKDDIVFTKIDRARKRFRFESHGVVQCFPLTSLLAAIKVNHVDYFSLDVQGTESKILKTLPFDDTLTIDIIQVEYELDPEGKEWILSFMQSRGYKVIYDGLANFIFERIKGLKYVGV